MSLQEIIQEVRTLSLEEQKQLIRALADVLAEAQQKAPQKQRSLREFRGVGAHLYDGTDA